MENNIEGPTMVNQKKTLFIICLTQFLCAIGFALALPLIAKYISYRWSTDESTTSAWASWFKFYSNLGIMIFTPIWGYIGDRYGRKLMLLRTCFGNAILYPCFLLAQDLYWLVVLRFIASAFSGTVSAALALAESKMPKEKHNFAIGMVLTCMSSGNLVGFAAGGFILHLFGFKTLFIISGIFYFVSGLLVHYNIEEIKEDDNAKKKSDSQSSKNIPVFSISFYAVLSLILVISMACKFDEQFTIIMIEHINGVEYSEISFALISVAASLGCALGSVFASYLKHHPQDKNSPVYLVIPVLLLFSGLTAALQSFSTSLYYYSVCRFFFFLFSGGLETICLTFLSQCAQDGYYSVAMSFSDVVKRSGYLLSAPVSIMIDQQWGLCAIYIFPSVIFILLIPVFLYFNRKNIKNVVLRLKKTIRSLLEKKSASSDSVKLDQETI